MRVTTLTLVMGLFVSTVFGGETIIIINGKAIRTSGSTITVKNDTVIVDGKVLSGNAVAGSGKRATENRELSSFTDLYLNIGADVTVRAGEQPKCLITADDNLLPLILTECSGHALRISATESYSSTQRIAIAIETPLVTRAEISGSGKINIAEVTKEKIALVINGSGDITAGGKAAELSATINGSGSLHAASLQAATVTVGINGSGNADVQATDALTADIHGSGNITYVGTPPTLQTTVNGSGKIANK
jgi:hypothetical protein